MRPTSPAWPVAIANTHRMVTVIESWLGDDQLAASVPIVSGSLRYDETGTLKRRLNITVPSFESGRRWDPAGDVGAPLGVYGQMLHTRTGIAYPNGREELMDHGWCLITKWTRDEAEGTVVVEAVDLAQLIADDALTGPSTPPTGATYASEFVRMVAGILPVVIDPALVDRLLPSTIVWERDRDKALDELCAAWPARWYVGDDRAVHVAPPWGPVSGASVPVITLTDGAQGTVSARQRHGERGALSNVVVVDGKADDTATGPPPHAVAQVTAANSPIRVDGPYRRVVRFHASDLIVTQAEADAAAAAALVTYATGGRAEGVAAVPDPALELGDIGRVDTRDGLRFTGRILSIDVPLTPADAPMSATVAMLPAGATTDPTTGGGV